MRIRDSRDEPKIPAKIKLSLGQIKSNTLFSDTNGRKRRRCDKNIHKAMIITVNINRRTKHLFVTVQGKKSCKLEFADHLWPPFLDQPHSDIVVFEIITFHIYNILVKKWKHGTGTNNIIKFNKHL